MKKSMLIVLLVVATVSLAVPRPGHAWGHGYGWYAPGAFVGGALFGAALARPYYAYPPPPVYVYPAPAYAYPAPAPAYAYPPQQGPYAYPGTPVPDRNSGYQSETLPGEWVTVPGQYVGGTWVPDHKVQVPVE
jgi:hypothetical protein